MNRDMLYRYVQLMNQYSVNNTLTPEEINFVNQVNQISQKDSNLIQLINRIRQTVDPNERLNIVNEYYIQNNELNQSTSAALPQSEIVEEPDVSNFETPIITPDMNTQSQFESQQVEPNLNTQDSAIQTKEFNQNLQNMEQLNQENNYTNFIDNINSDNYEANVYDKPKELKKTGFVNPFIFSLIFGFVGGAIVTTLLIILK